MDDIAIRVSGLGKEYRIGAQQERYRTLRDSLYAAAAAPVRGLKRRLSGEGGHRDPSFWALRDVSFDVRPGEVVGVIGRNGAGKSTLLKILSRITEPSSGSVDIMGRVGSLLEVGTGFHPELSGRENIALNGAILGMRRREIDRKFDEIVAFAEVEKFIDTPVKHYSSGMYLRLAFAVAAHLEPEILMVDEVLAVGDAAFQKRCLAKMQDVGQNGRTVLFVSHNLRAVARLCERVILMSNGQLAMDGPANEVVAAYLHSDLNTTAAREWSDPETAPGGEVARIRAARAVTQDGQIAETVDICDPVRLEVEYEVLRPGSVLMPTFLLFNEEDIQLFQAHDVDPQWRNRPRPVGRYVSTAWIPGNLLSEGRVFVDAGVTTLGPAVTQFLEHNAISFNVIDSLSHDGARGDWMGVMGGVMRPMLEWTTEYTPGGGTGGRPTLAAVSNRG